MKVGYVAGKYRASSIWGIEKNIQAARSVAEELWRLGYVVLCPHTNTAHFDGKVPNDEFLRGYLELLRRCDFVVLVPGWSRSRGARIERFTAKVCGIPCYEWIGLPGRELKEIA